MTQKLSRIIPVAIVLLILTACGKETTEPTTEAQTVAEATEEPTALATRAATSAPQIAETPTVEGPTATATYTQVPGCAYGAEFVADVTIPDATHIKPAEPFTKTWRFKNTGTCNWDANVVMAYSFGTQMSSVKEVSIPAAGAGETVDLSINLVAPELPGENVAVWSLTDKATGSIFGPQPYLRIIVSEDAAAPASGAPPYVVDAVAPSGCTDSAEFIADLNIPDNTVMEPGEKFTKSWRIRNSGTCTWSDDYKLIFLDGTLLAATNSAPVQETAPGATIDISVEMAAPTQPGNYTSIWQMQAPYGPRFGQVPYLRIVVPGDVTSTTPYPWLTGVDFHSRQIYLQGQTYGNRPNVFSKVGDSITFAWHFMWALGEGKASLGNYSNLGPAMNYFASENARVGNSFVNGSIAAYPGWRAVDLLDPSKSEAGCNGRSPIVCEYEIVRPSVAIIMIGTNDCTAHTSLSEYEGNLRTVVQTSIDYGVIPVLSTIPYIVGYCNAQDYNSVILTTARSFDVPLLDLYSVMEGLPNHGLDTDGVHPNVPPDNNPANFTGDNLNYGYTIRTLTALQTLDILWRQVMSY